MEHVDYPHHPGTLYDCLACEQGACVCVNGEGCVSEQCPGVASPAVEG